MRSPYDIAPYGGGIHYSVPSTVSRFVYCLLRSVETYYCCSLDVSHVLFVTNLPNDVTERELSILFRFIPGYQGVRLIARDGRIFAFVEYIDAQCSTVALTTFQVCNHFFF
jgi:hypothetical protein